MISFKIYKHQWELMAPNPWPKDDDEMINCLPLSDQQGNNYVPLHLYTLRMKTMLCCAYKHSYPKNSVHTA
jgi:hypothetical protein